MKYAYRISILCLLAQSLLLPGIASAQWQKKPYTEWSEKEVTTVLNNSPWGQTQTVTDTTRMFDRDRRLDSGQSRVSEVSQVKFHIRFFSARPIRQAVGRLIEIQQKGEVPEGLAAQLKALAAADFPDYIIITVSIDAADASSQLRQATTLLNNQATSQLKNETFLSVKGGQRNFLQEYQQPRRDGLGARFIFPRLVDGKPFITPENEEVLFSSQLNGGPALSMRFKVKDMMFNGRLEY
jgi:hypothetical protein